MARGIPADPEQRARQLANLEQGRAKASANFAALDVVDYKNEPAASRPDPKAPKPGTKRTRRTPPKREDNDDHVVDDVVEDDRVSPYGLILAAAALAALVLVLGRQPGPEQPA